MSNRLQAIKLSPVLDGLKFFQLEGLLSEEENLYRTQLRALLEKEVKSQIIQHVEKAELPEVLIQKLKPVFKSLIGAPYGNGSSSYVKTGITFMELARIDGGLATFFAVQYALVVYTLEKFGNTFQKDKYLSKIVNLEYLAGWGLTEKEYGSDASSLQTSAKKVKGGYIINGNKRWIGNGNKDFVIVWARESESKQIKGFIVENKYKGVQSEVIKNKLAVRIVQNCQLTFTDVFVPDENVLENANDFGSGPNQVLMHSRVSIPFLSVGLCLGVYDNVIEYVTNRKQFGKPLAGFQLQQERLVRINVTLSAVFMLALRTCRLADTKNITIGAISANKAWITSQARDVAKWGREMMGGNGILMENYVIRAFTDAEVVYTYEGTYDVNSLVAGRELTGQSAFK